MDLIKIKTFWESKDKIKKVMTRKEETIHKQKISDERFYPVYIVNWYWSTIKI